MEKELREKLLFSVICSTTVVSICHDLMPSEAFVCAERNIVCAQTIFVCAQTNTLDFGPRRQENANEYQNAK